MKQALLIQTLSIESDFPWSVMEWEVRLHNLKITPKNAVNLGNR